LKTTDAEIVALGLELAGAVAQPRGLLRQLDRADDAAVPLGLGLAVQDREHPLHIDQGVVVAAPMVPPAVRAEHLLQHHPSADLEAVMGAEAAIELGEGVGQAAAEDRLAILDQPLQGREAVVSRGGRRVLVDLGAELLLGLLVHQFVQAGGEEQVGPDGLVEALGDLAHEVVAVLGAEVAAVQHQRGHAVEVSARDRRRSGAVGGREGVEGVAVELQGLLAAPVDLVQRGAADQLSHGPPSAAQARAARSRQCRRPCPASW
jgi:hypothetical protein